MLEPKLSPEILAPLEEVLALDDGVPLSRRFRFRHRWVEYRGDYTTLTIAIDSSTVGLYDVQFRHPIESAAPAVLLWARSLASLMGCERILIRPVNTKTMANYLRHCGYEPHLGSAEMKSLPISGNG